MFQTNISTFLSFNVVLDVIFTCFAVSFASFYLTLVYHHFL